MSVAKAMMSAARTAPKGCGVDNLEIAALGLSRLSRLARKMREIGERDSKACAMPTMWRTPKPSSSSVPAVRCGD